MRRVKDPVSGLPAHARKCRAVHARQPVPFHRMATLRPEWSAGPRPLLTVLAAVIAFTLMASVLLVATVLILALAPGVNIALGVTSGDPTSPLDVGLALAMGALWLPAGIVAVRVGGWRPLGTAGSVAAKIRRRLLGSSALGVVLAGLGVVSLAAAAGAIVAAVLGTGDGTGLETGSEDSSTGLAVLRRAAVVVIALVLAPLQAIGMELSMRAVPMQAVGSRWRSPLLAIAAATLLALVARELSAAVLIPALTLACCAAVLAWKSGGLELPVLLTGTVTLVSVVLAAVLSEVDAIGSGAAAGASALVAASAAPGTSNAALPSAVAASDVLGSAALAGGIAGAGGLIVVTVVLARVIGTRSSVRALQPVGRDCHAPVPEPVAV